MRHDAPVERLPVLVLEAQVRHRPRKGPAELLRREAHAPRKDEPAFRGPLPVSGSVSAAAAAAAAGVVAASEAAEEEGSLAQALVPVS